MPEETAHQYPVICCTAPLRVHRLTITRRGDDETQTDRERGRESESQSLDSSNFRRQRFFLFVFAFIVCYTEWVHVRFISVSIERSENAFVSCFRIHRFTNSNFLREYFTLVFSSSLVQRQSHTKTIASTFSLSSSLSQYTRIHCSIAQ